MNPRKNTTSIHGQSTLRIGLSDDFYQRHSNKKKIAKRAHNTAF